jgi:hypothetical protein
VDNRVADHADKSGVPASNHRESNTNLPLAVCPHDGDKRPSVFHGRIGVPGVFDRRERIKLHHEKLY